MKLLRRILDWITRGQADDLDALIEPTKAALSRSLCCEDIEPGYRCSRCWKRR